MLEVLLNREDVSEKKKQLERDYGMVMTSELEGRMKEVCNLSSLVKEEGIAEGLTQGREQGILSTLAALVKDGVLSVSEAAGRAGLSEEEFKKKAGL